MTRDTKFVVVALLIGVPIAANLYFEFGSMAFVLFAGVFGAGYCFLKFIEWDLNR